MDRRDHPLLIGEAAPWFRGRSPDNPRYAFDTLGGRHVLLGFSGSSTDPDSEALAQLLQAHRSLFDDVHLTYFQVGNDPQDENLQRVSQALPGLRLFWDHDNAVAASFGLIDDEGRLHKKVYLLDPRLRVLSAFPLAEKAAQSMALLARLLPTLPRFAPPAPVGAFAPVLVVPRVFSPALCRTLIEAYDQHGGELSGFMRDIDGKTVPVHDAAHKIRRDHVIEDAALRRQCVVAIRQRLAPQIIRAFQFEATRLERHLVACYDAQEGGHFRAHRDNTTRGTAHRRFAVSLFLNTGAYEGGQLRFPEFGNALYSAPVGGAVVFSCSLLHEAVPVTAGKRYMYLPFVYDEAAATIRDANQHFIEDPNASEPSPLP